MAKSEIQSVIKNGENSFVEFKEAAVAPNTLAEELVRLHQNAIVLHIDNRPIPGTGIDLIDMEKVKDSLKNNFTF